MDDKQACKENSVDDHGSNVVLYAAPTCHVQINTQNTGINIGAHVLNLSWIIKSLERISRTATAMKSLSRKEGAFSHPGPKAPSIQIAAKPCPGAAARPAARPFPTQQGHAV